MNFIYFHYFYIDLKRKLSFPIPKKTNFRFTDGHIPLMVLWTNWTLLSHVISNMVKLLFCLFTGRFSTFSAYAYLNSIHPCPPPSTLVACGWVGTIFEVTKSFATAWAFKNFFARKRTAGAPNICNHINFHCQSK